MLRQFRHAEGYWACHTHASVQSHVATLLRGVYVIMLCQNHASTQCMSACLLMCGVAGQVVVQLAVDKSRSVCLSVANGEVDVAIIGGHVPEDLKDVLHVILHGSVFILWVTTCAKLTVPSTALSFYLDDQQQERSSIVARMAITS